jgi:hypothetical protein
MGNPITIFLDGIAVACIPHFTHGKFLMRQAIILTVVAVLSTAVVVYGISRILHHSFF